VHKKWQNGVKKRKTKTPWGNVINTGHQRGGEKAPGDESKRGRLPPHWKPAVPQLIKKKTWVGRKRRLREETKPQKWVEDPVKRG